MTYSNDVVTVSAVSDDQAGTYIMRVTHSTVSSGNLSYNTITVTLSVCVVTHIALPTNPGAQSYTIHSPKLSLDLSNPGFAQVPAC